jgi:hypothetical protein
LAMHWWHSKLKYNPRKASGFLLLLPRWHKEVGYFLY